MSMIEYQRVSYLQVHIEEHHQRGFGQRKSNQQNNGQLLGQEMAQR